MFGRETIRDIRRLYDFFLAEERRAELARMGRVRRAVSMLLWILKSLLLKLSPARRLLLVAAFICTLVGFKRFRMGDVDLTVNFHPWAFLLVLIVLMLELRDKLLAKDEIAVARQVQLALLPARDPQIPGWGVWSYTRPANDVGGDLVDYVDLDGFRHGVVVADVSEKGSGRPCSRPSSRRRSARSCRPPRHSTTWGGGSTRSSTATGSRIASRRSSSWSSSTTRVTHAT